MKIDRQKKATTGAMNKAERVVLRLIMEEDVIPFRVPLSDAVRKHLGIPTEYLDATKQKPIPPEYAAAIELAHKLSKRIIDRRAREKALEAKKA